jgi:hypothetical protein
MDKVELLEYLNKELPRYDGLIAQQEQLQRSIDQSILMQEQNIVSLKEQIIISQETVATFQKEKVYVNELIVIVEATSKKLQIGKII